MPSCAAFLDLDEEENLGLLKQAAIKKAKKDGVSLQDITNITAKDVESTIANFGAVRAGSPGGGGTYWGVGEGPAGCSCCCFWSCL